jgi:uncharacterized protein involved in tolerance to divalent cations
MCGKSVTSLALGRNQRGSMWRTYLLEHYGDLASVVGLVITIGGFVATIRRVRKAIVAAEEAKQAAREAVQRIKLQVLTTEIAACLQRLRSVDSACRDRDWKEALVHCDEARTLISTFRDHHGLSEEEKQSLVVIVDQLGKLIPHIQSLRSKHPEKDLTPRRAEEVHTMITTLARLLGRHQTESLEVWDD